jgi:hypothetical protein
MWGQSTYLDDPEGVSVFWDETVDECEDNGWTHTVAPAGTWVQSTTATMYYTEGVFSVFLDTAYDSELSPNNYIQDPYTPGQVASSYALESDHALFLTNVVFTLISTSCGDPHFVGFDGKEFDFHGHVGNYILYQDNAINIIGRFKFNTDPGFPLDYTYISEMRFQFGNQDITITERYHNKEIPYFEREKDKKRINKTCLASPVRYISGEIEDVYYLRHKNNIFIVSLMDYNGIKHLNLTVKGNPKNATGIIGQTRLPQNERKANESFEIKLWLPKKRRIKI